MNTPNNINQACPSGQDAAGSAEGGKLTTAEIAKALGASVSISVGHMEPHEQLAWFSARMRQQAQGIPFRLVSVAEAEEEDLAAADKSSDDLLLPPEDAEVLDGTDGGVAYVRYGCSGAVCLIRNANYQIGDRVKIRRLTNAPNVGKVV